MSIQVPRGPKSSAPPGGVYIHDSLMLLDLRLRIYPIVYTFVLNPGTTPRIPSHATLADFEPFFNYMGGVKDLGGGDGGDGLGLQCAFVGAGDCKGASRPDPRDRPFQGFG